MKLETHLMMRCYILCLKIRDEILMNLFDTLFDILPFCVWNVKVSQSLSPFNYYHKFREVSTEIILECKSPSL